MHFSVGNIIYGRVLLNGDVNQAVRVPSDAQLVVRLEDISLADASSTVLKQTQISNLTTFPFYYRLQIPTKISSALSYTLSAEITKGDTLLYITDTVIPVKTDTKSPITIDIPVVAVKSNSVEESLLNDMEQLSWPELVGREGTYAVEYIKETSGLTNVFTILEGTPVTMDYRNDRVRVFVDKHGIVTQIPRTG